MKAEILFTEYNPTFNLIDHVWEFSCIALFLMGLFLIFRNQIHHDEKEMYKGLYEQELMAHDFLKMEIQLAKERVKNEKKD